MASVKTVVYPGQFVHGMKTKGLYFVAQIGAREFCLISMDTGLASGYAVTVHSSNREIDLALLVGGDNVDAFKPFVGRWHFTMVPNPEQERELRRKHLGIRRIK